MSQANPPSTDPRPSAAKPKARPSTCKKRKAKAEAEKNTIESSHLYGSRQSPQSSDLAFVCNGLELMVHKAVVLPHSPVIRAAVQGSFLEAQTNVIRMDNFQPDTVCQLVQFMYMDSYSFSPEQATSPLPAPPGGVLTMPAPTTAASAPAVANAASQRIVEHVRVNSITEYYGIPALEKLANDQIRTIVHSVPAERDRFWFHDLLPLVREALQMTGDKELFAVLAQAVVKNPDYFEAPDQVRGLEALPGFYTQVVQVYRKMHEETAKVMRELAGQKGQYLRGMRAKGQILMDQESAIIRHRAALATLNRTDNCAKCSAEFPCTINPSQCRLRCLKCDHEHAD